MKKFYAVILGLSLPFIAVAGLETGTFISDLVDTNPTGTDDYATADDHVRLIKSTVKNTFPNINGAVAPTDEELNLIDGLLATSTELNTLDGIAATLVAAELNLLDGLVANATELNLLDGKTGTVWTSTNDGPGSTLNADLLDSISSAAFALDSDIGTTIQAFDANLDQLSALAVTNNNFIVGNGSAWVAETGATARASLGLGTLATLSSIDNGEWSGVDLAVVNGGTGASDAGTARTNLGAAATSHNHSAADITSGTLALARGGTGQTTMDNVSEQVTLQWTIAVDPGGTPVGSPGDVFAFY